MIFEKCILCNQPFNKQTGQEHIIPDYLGGRLKEIILCNGCNKGIGAKLYSYFKYDTYIRHSGNYLKNVLPKIHKNIEITQSYKTKSPVGTNLKAKRTKDNIYINPGKQSDGSFVLPTKDAVSYLATKLTGEDGINEIESTKKASEIILSTPNLKMKRFNANYKFIRWNAADFKMDFENNRIVDQRSPTLMAFEFLSLLLGKTIYDNKLNHIKSFVNNNSQTNNISVKYFIGKKPLPFHRIFPEYLDDGVVVNIWLFEYVVYKVKFLKLIINKVPDFVYLEDLKNRKSLGAYTVKDAKGNNWREFLE